MHTDSPVTKRIEHVIQVYVEMRSSSLSKDDGRVLIAFSGYFVVVVSISRCGVMRLEPRNTAISVVQTALNAATVLRVCNFYPRDKVMPVTG
jgi:hypothetical protein